MSRANLASLRFAAQAKIWLVLLFISTFRTRTASPTLRQPNNGSFSRIIISFASFELYLQSYSCPLGFYARSLYYLHGAIFYDVVAGAGPDVIPYNNTLLKLPKNAKSPSPLTFKEIAEKFSQPKYNKMINFALAECHRVYSMFPPRT
jgi:hypothetical protein